MSNWVTLSTTQGTGDTIVSLTASTNNTQKYRRTNYKVFTNARTEIVTIKQEIATNYPYLTVFYNIQTTGNTEIFNTMSETLEGTGYTYTVSKYRVDGGEWITIPNGEEHGFTHYTHFFTTTGEHYVEIVPKTYYEVPRWLLTDTSSDPWVTHTVTKVYVPNNITVIRTVALYNSTLNYVYLHDNISIIEEMQLYSFTSGHTISRIPEIDLPKNLSYIPTNFASNNTYLSKVNIQKDSLINYFGTGCFWLCGFESIVIPEHTTALYKGAFGACNELKDIYAFPTTAPFLSNDESPDTNGEWSNTPFPFEGIASGGTLHYPVGSDYSSWMRNEVGFLGYYGWTAVADL